MSDVIEYVTEEVSRQGHDVTALDGIERVAWMLEAWGIAIRRASYSRLPGIRDAVDLGKYIEREKNFVGLRNCEVRVGNRMCPRAIEVPGMLGRLFDNISAATPIEFYKEFELIHPFRDGNGRTGKIILNWINGTLLDPIFPPADLFGYPIRNP